MLPAAPEFQAWVAEGYTRRPPLDGWKATARLMARDWPRSSVESGSSAESLRSFLQAAAGRPVVLYLAAHHEPGGQVDLPGSGPVSWLELWPRSGTENWIVVLDLCHARAAALPTGAAACLLFTAEAQEKTWELGLFSPRTSPLAGTGQPLASLREALGPDWNGRISAWGLGWALSAGPRPVLPQDWQQRLLRAQGALKSLPVRRSWDFRSSFSLLQPPYLPSATPPNP